MMQDFLMGVFFCCLFFSFAEAGVPDGAKVAYLLTEGGDFELGEGVYASAGPTLTRAAAIRSKIAGTAGTAKLTLAGGGEVRIVAVAADYKPLRSVAALAHRAFGGI